MIFNVKISLLIDKAIIFGTMKVAYSLLRPFLYFTTNQFALKFIKMANLIIYFVKICNIY